MFGLTLTSSFSLALLVAPAVGAQEGATADPASQAQVAQVPEGTLSKEEAAQVEEAIGHLNAGRSGEALFLLESVATDHPNQPALMNLIGAAYVSNRELKKAEELFKKAAQIAPQSPEVRFNLAELSFVSKRFVEAQQNFSNLLNQFPAMPEPVLHLIQYKILICKLMQDPTADVTKELKNFTFDDDTPAYYMSRAVMHLIRGDNEKAAEWLTISEKIYTQPELDAYADAMKEMDLIPNMEGGGIDLSGGESRPVAPTPPAPTPAGVSQ